MPSITGDVVFQDVDFAYVPGRTVLRIIVFMRCGSGIRLCGPTGAGKSTIINILTR
jgi:ATP-binding cassette subfamily B protein